MSTSIPAARLVQLRTQSRAKGSRHTDPAVIINAMSAVRRRPYAWVDAVLGRDAYARRSVAYPDLPWLEPGEEYLLVAADVEEDRVEFEGITAAAGALPGLPVGTALTVATFPDVMVRLRRERLRHTQGSVDALETIAVAHEPQWFTDRAGETTVTCGTCRDQYGEPLPSPCPSFVSIAAFVSVTVDPPTVP